jgi:hypothetical protein
MTKQEIKEIKRRIILKEQLIKWQLEEIEELKKKLRAAK